VERHENQVVKGRIEQAEQKTGSGITAGNGDRLAAQGFGWERLPGDQQGTAPPPEGTAGTEQHVVIPDETEEMIGYLADVQSSCQDETVEGLHILQPLSEVVAATCYQSVHQGIEDEGVVGTRGEA
jgi:hypothetical protein